MRVKLHYYPETDSLHIELQPGPSVETGEITPELVADFDAESRVVDFDHASKHLDLSTLETIDLPLADTETA